MNDSDAISDRSDQPSSPRRLLRLLGLAVIVATASLATWVVTIELALWRGAACLETRNHERALSWLQLAERISFERAELNYLLARCHRRLGHFDEVESHLRRAFDLGWDVRQLEREQWLALAQTGQYEKVAPYWSVLFENPGSDGPEISKAYVAASFALFRFRDALAVLAAWKNDFPDDPEPYVMHARLAETHLKWALAVKLYGEALERTPHRSDARFGLGRALVRQGEVGRAEKELLRVVQEEPADLDAKVSLAMCAAKLDRANEAIAIYEEVLQAAPDNLDALLELGNLELAAGRSATALEYFRRAAKVRPESREVIYGYARALQAEGKGEEAQEHFGFVEEASRPLAKLKKLLDQLLKEPENLDVRFELASITWRYKSRDEGEKWWRSLLKIAPYHQPTHAALADHYTLVGDQKKAAYHRHLAGISLGDSKDATRMRDARGESDEDKAESRSSNGSRHSPSAEAKSRNTVKPANGTGTVPATLNAKVAKPE